MILRPGRRSAALLLSLALVLASSASPLEALAQVVRAQPVNAGAASPVVLPVRAFAAAQVASVSGPVLAPAAALLPSLAPLPVVKTAAPVVSAAAASPASSARGLSAASPSFARGSALFRAPAARADAPAVSAGARLETAVETLEEGRKGQAPEAQSSAWRRYWSGAKASAAAGAVDAGAPSARPSVLGRFRAGAAKTHGVPAPAAASALGAAAVLPSASVALPAWVAPLLKAALPYVEASGVLLGTWALAHLAGKALDALWKGKGYGKNSLIVARLVANVVLWGVGASLALTTAGLEWKAVLSGLGIGGLAVSLAVKKFVGNFISGAMLLLDHPFHFGETVRIGKTVYTVKDITFRYLVLESAQDPGGRTLMDYATLSKAAIHLSRRLETRSLREEPVQAAPADKVGRFRFKRAAMLLAGAALAYGGYVLHGAAAAARPFLNAAFAFGGFWLAAQAAIFLHGKLAARRGWDPRVAPLVRVLVRTVAYAAGAIASLSLAGVSWPTLLASAGVLSVAVGVAASDFLSNLIEAATILLTQPFKVGDRIRAGDEEGRVVDMTLRYVVLETEKDGAVETVLLPYPLVASALTVYEAPSDASSSR